MSINRKYDDYSGAALIKLTPKAMKQLNEQARSLGIDPGKFFQIALSEYLKNRRRGPKRQSGKADKRPISVTLVTDPTPSKN